MKTPVKLGIVVALIATVLAVLALKRVSTASRSPERNLSPEATLAQRLPKLIDLGAGKCLQCKQMAPVLEELRREYVGRLQVVFIDVWQNPDAGKAYGIQLIPTQIFYDATGKELFRHEGFISGEDILSKWKELGIDFSTPMPKPTSG